MRIETNENGEMVLKEVYNGIGLVSNAGERFGICMRDSGFEFSYQGKWYHAHNGVVTWADGQGLPVKPGQNAAKPTLERIQEALKHLEKIEVRKLGPKSSRPVWGFYIDEDGEGCFKEGSEFSDYVFDGEEELNDVLNEIMAIPLPEEEKVEEPAVKKRYVVEGDPKSLPPIGMPVLLGLRRVEFPSEVSQYFGHRLEPPAEGAKTIYLIFVGDAVKYSIQSCIWWIPLSELENL